MGHQARLVPEKRRGAARTAGDAGACNAMMHALRRELPPPAEPGVTAAAPADAGPRDSAADIRSGRPLRAGRPPRTDPRSQRAHRGASALLRTALDALVEGVARIHFRRIDVVGGEHVPAAGAVLVVANHPAAWTDALVLDIALGRGLRFVAHEGLFHPWIRGVFLKLYAPLPVRPRSEGPQAIALNRRTFERCHALLERGAAIAVFPEGVSGSDRGLRPLKHGAARLVLEHVAAGNPAPAVVPVAIRYEDRTAFRTAVDVAVGEPIAIAGAAAGGGDPEAARHVLTAAIARGLEAALAAAGAHAAAVAAVEVGSRTSAPGDARHRAAAGLASVLAGVGRALHATPVWAIERLAWRLAGLPQQVSFGRMLFGVVLVPLWYGGLTILAARLGGGAWFAIPAAAPLLGFMACREVDRKLAARDASPAAATGEGA